MPRLSKIGAACLAAFGFTTGGVQNVTASYLVVAGGGGGGAGSAGGGGGGAGGYQTGTTSLNPTLSYTVIVGAGGVGGAPDDASHGANGNNSQFGTLTASVGGGWGGGGNTVSPYSQDGNSGGSGGGGRYGGNGGAGTSSQGYAGGSSVNTGFRGGGGGGGAGAVGSNGTTSVGGNGGVGVASSISGTSTYYAGGGGGGAYSSGTGGTGGNGGGGNGQGGTTPPTQTSGTANTGGGGGANGIAPGTSIYGGNGGSGVVIISYAGAQQFGGGVVTTDGTNTIHTFTTSGTLSPLNSLTASYLIVGGGGGGSFNTNTGGGGGSGGTLTSSSFIIDTSSTYLVTVGSGGAAASSNQFGENGTAGVASSFAGLITGLPTYPSLGAAGTSGNGYAGGTTPAAGSGGGGGASAAGSNGSGNNGGAGGVGITSSITGTSTQYAGGGSGGSDTGTVTAGIYGGGSGASTTTPATAATANTGGGGGGGRSGYFSGSNQAASAGGSGIVVIAYAGSTQQMAGGTVTIVGGNVIHTFTTSGYLTPLTYFGNSLRFRSSASAYLNRTPTVAGNRQKWTWSGWVKRGALGSYQGLFDAVASAGTTYGILQFLNTDILQWYDQSGGSATMQLETSQVFRDPAAWYHIVIAYDSTQATSSNRAKMYINGVQVTAFSTGNYPAQNTNSNINNTIAHDIARYGGGGNYLDGYMTNINFIDGQALAPTAFGTFNSYGVWQPVNYGGSYGTNGFYLPFTNTTSTTTLGYDFSPNGNNWTTNNISLTAGSTYDSMTDVPTLTSANVANYCVLNPLVTPATTTIINGNLGMSGYTNYSSVVGTIGVSSGKWYYEIIAQTNVQCGITGTLNGSYYPGQAANSYVWDCAGAVKINNDTGTSYGSATSSGDIVGVAFDLDSGTITFYKNGTSQGTAFSSIPAGTYFPVARNGNSVNTSVNFGQQPFSYTPPSGYLPLNTYNM